MVKCPKCGMKCKNCGHTIMVVKKKDLKYSRDFKYSVSKLFLGDTVHKNIGGEWAVICRVKRCGCLKPEKE